MEIELKIQLDDDAKNAIQELVNAFAGLTSVLQNANAAHAQRFTELAGNELAKTKAPEQIAPDPAAATITPVPLAPPPTYTLDQLAQAGVAMCQTADGRERAQAVLQQFGISRLTDLPKEKYGSFATALRQAGAEL